MTRVGIHFYGVDQKDILSRIGHTYLSLVRGEPYLTHCAVAIDDVRYDMTLKGITIYTDVIEERQRPPLVCLSWDVSELEAHSMTTRVALMAALKTRLKLLDFIGYAFGRKNVFLCTDFAQCVLGEMPQGYTPQQLEEAHKQKEYVRVFKTRELPEVWK